MSEIASENKNITRKFSEGFIKDLGYLLECCKENRTDNISLEFDINGKTLIADIQFIIKVEQWEQKVCSNGQICKHPNCSKCGTTHSMSDCNYTKGKKDNNELYG